MKIKFEMSRNEIAAAPIIGKEDVSRLQFPTAEVLNTADAIEKRKKSLEQSVVLGNTYKGKTRIVFEDNESVRQIETHIWGLTDKRVILKQGIVIPIHRIHEVIL